MTNEEREKIERRVRHECAMIAAFEQHYWANVDDDRPHMMDIAMGAMGSAANICAAIFRGISATQCKKEIEARDKEKM